ncbi:MAG: extracellular solute-binding protein [Anaerolineae bacterium]|nr:extracellular solute-binding protein [Anaerolineae bacterium]
MLGSVGCSEAQRSNALAKPLQTDPASPEKAEPDFIKQAAKPYQGTVIRGISENTPASTYIRDVLVPDFEEETGITVEMEVTPYDNMYTLTIQDLRQGSGIYDFIYVEQDFFYSYLDKGFLVDLSEAMEEYPQLNLPDFDPVDFTSFINEFRDPNTQDLYGVPIEAFPKMYLYRKDLFEDPDIQAAFAAKYNYPLAPAITVDQYRDNAEFFTRYGQEHHLELWGTTVQAALGHSGSFYEFFETIAPPFGIYNWGINLDNYKATVANGGQLDSPQAKKALAFWVDLLQYAPPESIHSAWNEVAETFAAGRAAQGWVYGENTAWIATDASRSKVVGNVGVALPPTAPGVIEDVLIGQGYIGYYDGGAFGIAHASKNKEATWLWLQYLGQPDIQPEWAANSSRVVHLSTFDDALVRSQDKKLNRYYTLMKEQGQLFAGAPPFPFHIEIRDLIAPYIHRAITGDLTPEQALDMAAVAVDEELVRLGYGQ